MGIVARMRKTVGAGIAGMLVALALAAAVYGQEQAKSTGHGFDRLGNKVQFGGYYELEYEDNRRINGADGEADFDQHRAILFFGAKPHERIQMFSELEFEHGANADDLKLEQAWLEYKVFDGSNLRGGIDLIPVGRLNLNHEGNLRDFVFRPVSAGNIIPTTWYEAGIWVNGDILDNVSYTVGVSNGLRESTEVGDFSELRKMRRTTVLSENDNNNDKAVSGRLAVSPWLGTEFGVSGYRAKYSSTDPGPHGAGIPNPDSTISILALDWFIPWRQWELKGEYAWVDKDEQAGANAMTGASGGYVELAYHFFPESLRDSFLGKGFDNPTFTAMVRYERLDFDTSGNDDLHDRDIISIGLNYRPIEQMAFKVSYDFESRDEAGAEGQDRFGAGMVLGF